MERSRSLYDWIVADLLSALSRAALVAGPLGRRLENLRTGRLGLFGYFSTFVAGVCVFRIAHREWLQPMGGTCRGRLWPGSDPRNRAGFRGGGSARIPGAWRTGSGRSESAGIYNVLAGQPPTPGGSPGVCAQLRSVVEGRISQVCEIERALRTERLLTRRGRGWSVCAQTRRLCGDCRRRTSSTSGGGRSATRRKKRGRSGDWRRAAGGRL